MPVVLHKAVLINMTRLVTQKLITCGSTHQYELLRIIIFLGVTIQSHQNSIYNLDIKTWVRPREIGWIAHDLIRRT